MSNANESSGQPAKQEKIRMGTAVVAKGRTVVFEGRTYGPEEKVSLPADEIARLRGLGYLANPDAPEVARGNGPVFEAAEGPSVKVAA